MKIRKKQLFALGVIVSCMAIFAMGTTAYFTAENKAHSVITSGHIDIELIEKTEENGVLVDFPAEGIGKVMPATSVSKLVSVQNTGENEAWIRISVDTRIVSESGQELPTELEEGIPAVIYTVNEDQWISRDGWYYYAHPVASKQVTELLFDRVGFAPEMGNAYQGCKVYIAIEAQAVQTANNPVPDGGDVTDLVGWPQEVTD